MSRWINYKELKQEIAFVDVLEHYNVSYRITGDQAKATCPLPGHDSDSKKRSLSINLDRNIFQCFGCGAKGNVLDFIARIEGLDPTNGQSFKKAARIAQERFCYKDNRREGSRPGKKSADDQPSVLVNPPLDFSLKGLDAKHPFFAEHGLEPRTVAHFGLGYCSRGYLKGRIAIPLHDLDGNLIGYAGRIIDQSHISEKTPKYLLPGNRKREGVSIVFDNTTLLYNAHRIESGTCELFVAADIDDVWQLWQSGLSHCVGVIGTDFGAEHEKLASALLAANGRLWAIHSVNP
jgi:DNA primase